MSQCASVIDRALDLPPPYSLVVLREAGDAFAHACAIAGEQGAGAMVWVRRFDVAEFAVVLEPEEAFAHSRLAIYAGMSALADALTALAPPSRPVTFDWPDAIRVDGVLVGGGRLGWPEGTRDDETPAWLVFSAMIRTAVVDTHEPGLRPLLGALDELGFESADSGEIIASFSRHLMTAFDEWSDAGFAPLARRWLDRVSPSGQNVRIADNGDLLLSGFERQSLAEALASPTWFDPATGMPWL
ncbi:hypothetical protein KEU06_03270 [Pseudaminobacter sp. 19-2017]|uniref:BPL/LPL catalytic domain-containing protein n=1 Tax=Pseudaminobacter soli (ex Zhang et al. 2022) TaxID=2831468 RepID=A0A942I6T0_9HYPH|nr:biotin/lipoate--protein ligase family protein [Pseudaminobacter soli]MBS3647645.1 hypothetical protein [Pseudaminobacter soli]